MSEKRDIDWTAIQADYGSGMSFGALALKYSVSKSYLIERRNRDQWNRPTARPQADRPTDPIRLVRPELPSIPSAVDGANYGIAALVKFLREKAEKMDPMDHVKAATALVQYNKIVVNALPEAEEEGANLEHITIDTRALSSDELMRLKAFAVEMKEQQVG